MKFLYTLELFHQVPDSLSILLHPSSTQNYELVDDHIPTFESSSASFKQRLKKKWGLRNVFRTIRSRFVLFVQSPTARHTSVEENLEEKFNANDWDKLEKNPRRSMIWQFHFLHWNFLKSRNMTSSVNSSVHLSKWF